MSGGLNWDRELTGRDLAAIDAAVRDLIKRCGGCEAAGEQAHRDKARMSRYGSPNSGDHAPLDARSNSRNLAEA